MPDSRPDMRHLSARNTVSVSWCAVDELSFVFALFRRFPLCRGRLHCTWATNQHLTKLCFKGYNIVIGHDKKSIDPTPYLYSAYIGPVISEKFSEMLTASFRGFLSMKTPKK